MTLPHFYTIGVYERSLESFFGTLKDQQIDTFVDIRRRRAVRGSKYAFVNSTRLQRILSEMGINYLHVIELAPTNEIRQVQKMADKSEGVAKSNRSGLSSAFVDAYNHEILDHYNLESLLRQLEHLESKRAVLFCVEHEAKACHRSLVAKRLTAEYGVNIIDL